MKPKFDHAADAMKRIEQAMDYLEKALVDLSKTDGKEADFLTAIQHLGVAQRKLSNASKACATGQKWVRKQAEKEKP